MAQSWSQENHFDYLGGAGKVVGKPNKKDLEKKQEKSNLNTQELEENGI